MVYKIFKCNYCKKFNMSSAKKYFKCKYCQKNINIEKRKIYFEDLNPTIVSKVLIKLKEESFKQDNFFEGEDDFYNYEVNFK